MDRRDISKVLLGTFAGAGLSERATAQSCVSPCYPQTAAEIAASVTPANTAFPPGALLRYKSGSVLADSSNDWSGALQAACNQCITGGAEVVIPGTSGFYRCNTAIGLTSGCRIRSDGTQPTLRFYGCNGFVLAQGQANLIISGVELFSLTAAGSVDPKSYDAIAALGTNSSHCNYVFCRDLYLRGWNRCVDFQYTWNSTIDNCTTINCNIGVRLFGQCASDSISDCRLVANTGTHSIKCEKDVAIRPEGLVVINSVMAMGVYGLQTDGLLALEITNCVVDQISDTAFDLTNVPALSISGSWIYAANYGVRWQPVSVPVDQQATISSCRIETTASNSFPLFIDANNNGISITGGTLVSGPSGSARCIYIQIMNSDISMVGTHLVNQNVGNASIFAGSPGFRHAALTGDTSIYYFAPDRYTGTLTQCTTAPTAQIIYSVTGDLVTLQIPALAAFSANSNQPQITGMPAAIRPQSRQMIVGSVIANGTGTLGLIGVETNGNLTIFNGAGGPFSSGTAKGANSCTVTYRRT